MPSLNLTHHPQRQGADCLAACAWMALDFVGVHIRYERLLQLLKVRQGSGASFLNLALLESHFNSLSVVIAREYDDPMGLLETYLVNSYPVIASVNTIDLPYWAGEAVDHAVVIAGLDEATLLIYDPWFTAPQTVASIQFESAWMRHTFLYAIITKRA
ncbi:MAG: hypothetical protein KDE47_03420 [Caldilineaceae bacterium]|nr:hypothetical protein [Caldilineaceae bacterium]MCB0098449.1 hypothetical protein [Caldilineaceae bacterium]MCB9156241.1 hypothetical protein [Caldilineaceae bacterium]